MLKKHLIYFFYIPLEQSDYWKQMYQVHVNCINSYNHVFDKYTLLLAFDNDVDDNFINAHQQKIIDDLQLQDCTYVIELCENKPHLKEGIHFYNHVLTKLDNFKDEMILWGHNKTDSHCPFSLSSKWVSISHFQLRYDIAKIEEQFFNDVNICCYGASLMVLFCPEKLSTHYSGSFYWFYPDKIMHLFKEQISIYLQLVDLMYKTKNNNADYYTDNVYNVMMMISENWITDIFSVPNLGHMNKIIPVLLLQTKDNSTYGLFNYDNLNNDMYMNESIWENNNIFSEEIFNEFYKYYESIIRNIS